jgi:hypothetical protein
VTGLVGEKLGVDGMGMVMGTSRTAPSDIGPSMLGVERNIADDWELEEPAQSVTFEFDFFSPQERGMANDTDIMKSGCDPKYYDPSTTDTLSGHHLLFPLTAVGVSIFTLLFADSVLQCTYNINILYISH